MMVFLAHAATFVRVTPRRSARVASRVATRAQRSLFCSLAEPEPPTQYPVAALAWDLETTGLDTSTAEIVQLSIVCVNSARETPPVFTRLVMPKHDVPVEASNVHGWTRDRLADEGAEDFASVWAEAQQWLDDSFPSTSPLVWAAHNGHNYDRPILLRHIAEAAQPPPRVARWVDTLHFARRAIRPKRYGPGQYTLGRLYSDATGESLAGAHDAEVDTRALGRVWRWLVEEVDDAPLKFQSYLQREAYPPPAPAPSAAAEAAGDDAAPERRRKRRAAPKVGVALDDDAALDELPGVGALISTRLQSRGIECVGDLRRLYDEQGRDYKAMRSAMRKMLPGVNFMAINKLVASVGASAEAPEPEPEPEPASAAA